jgi:dTDP-4-amino-4,6-dideoxygalactose transaminase
MSAPEIRHELQSKLGTEYGPEEEAAVLETLRAGASTGGEACIAFEKAFAEYCGVAHARAVSNGTAALFLSMKAMGIGPGDRVLTTPLTWVATAAAPATLGAEVDFVDIDPNTYNMDPARLEAKLTPNTKAVIPVHLYGGCCDMNAILRLSEQNGFAVVEDACHAPGAAYGGHKAGSMGVTGCFSFHEQKNMSTLGEGGMVVTNDPDVYEHIALYRSHCTRVHGGSSKYCALDPERFPMDKRFWWQDFDDTGYNMRMTDVQAAVGLMQLRKLDALNQRRIDIAAYWRNALADIPGLRIPDTVSEGKHVYHLLPMEIDAAEFGVGKDDFVRTMLHEFGIRIGTHYIPLHYSTAFQQRGFKRGQFPVVEAVHERLVTLPVHPRLNQEGLDYLAESIKALQRR